MLKSDDVTCVGGVDWIAITRICSFSFCTVFGGAKRRKKGLSVVYAAACTCGW